MHRLLIVCIIALLAACLPPPATPPPTQDVWISLADGIQALNGSDGIAAIRHDPARARYAAIFEPLPQQARSVGAWLSSETQALAAVNCGFYAQDGNSYRHIGLLMAGNTILQPLQSGWGSVLIIRNRQVTITPRPQKLRGPGALGIQGWPLLLWNGQVVADLNNSTPERRTAVGIDGKGRVLWVVSSNPLSLDAFARRLRQLDLALLDAVNLDGGISSGLRWRQPSSNKMVGPNNLATPCALLLYDAIAQ